MIVAKSDAIAVIANITVIVLLVMYIAQKANCFHLLTWEMLSG